MQQHLFVCINLRLCMLLGLLLPKTNEDFQAIFRFHYGARNAILFSFRAEKLALQLLSDSYQI